MVLRLLCGSRCVVYMLVSVRLDQMNLRPLEGEVFVVDKPYGWSSFHVVKKIRGTLMARLRKSGVRKLKVGHAGTLDPLATGVMILCTGRATKRIDELQAGVKTYTARIALGATTPSFDLETPVDAIFPTEHITCELVEEVLGRFRGSILQVPPVFSAVKVDGHRAYKMARTGQEVELKAKPLQIDELELLSFSPTEITVRVVCSKGTYIRALARDIGAALESGGHLVGLRRDAVGDRTLDAASPVEDMVAAIAAAPMTINDEEGNEIEVAPMDYDVSAARRDAMDIRPWHERNLASENSNNKTTIK